MTRPFGNSDKRFSIDDAFEEETDEAIKVYGATGDRSPLQTNKYKNGSEYMASSKTYKCTDDTTSRDSDSLIHEYVEATQSAYCWNHPKVRENWKTVCAAVVLLVVGVGLLGMGAFAVAEPENGLQGAVFFVAGEDYKRMHEYVEATQSAYCWNHPKVRENWKTVCAAVVLLVVGVGLLGMGAFAVAEPENGLQGAVFFVAGMICFVPGAYHVVYIWLAARGQRGYDFYHLPLFT